MAVVKESLYRIHYIQHLISTQLSFLRSDPFHQSYFSLQISMPVLAPDTGARLYPRLLVSCPPNINQKGIFCQTGMIYPNGSIGTYPSMPSYLVDAHEMLHEIVRFFFWSHCLSRICLQKQAIQISSSAKRFQKRRNDSLCLRSYLCLPTDDVLYLRHLEIDVVPRRHKMMPQRKSCMCLSHK